MKHADLPLSSLLSQALVTFTIEFDNEFEHRMPHQTSRHGGTPGAPWLVSLAMWSNCMQFVGEEGISVRELEKQARTTTNLRGMMRWGYVFVSPDKIVRAKPNGRRAQEVWRPLFGEIEKRWKERFGEDAVDRLRRSLWSIVSRIDVLLPDCLPILGYGLFSRGPKAIQGPEDRVGLPLSALLSKVLLTFAMEFERDSRVSLAICANVLRVLDDKGVRIRDLPPRSGVSKEAVSVALGILRKMHLAVEEPDPAGARGKVVRLTANGAKTQDGCHQLIEGIEARWEVHFGGDAIRDLRTSLEALSGRLFEGLEPYSDGWRASASKPETLPHFPMVLHRGGFPDGA